MKKFLWTGLFIVTALFLVFGLTLFLPKYAGFLRIFLFLLFIDTAFWLTVKQSFSGYHKSIRFTIAGLFWLPLLMAAVALVIGLLIPFLEWPVPFRTYFVSILVILFLMKLLPLIVWAFSMIFGFLKFLVLRFSSVNRSRARKPGMGKPVIAAWIAGFVIAMIMVGGMIFGQFAFKILRQEIVITDLPESFDGFKIVHISDLHLGSWTDSNKLSDAVDSINVLNPDVIFMTGDMFNYRTNEGDDFGHILKRLNARHGTYVILGNHDYGDYITWPDAESKQKNMEDLKTWYQNLDWKLLLNSHDFIRIENDSIVVIGVENWGSTRRFQRFGNVEKELKGAENVSVQLLLSHDPSYWDKVISKKHQNIDLTLSGHTHGGQIGIVTKNFSWSPSSWAYPYWDGLYENPGSHNRQYLYVNPGLGNILYSGRIGIRPEITLLILKKN